MPAANIAASLRNNRQRLGNAGKANDVPAVYDPNQSHSALSGLVVLPLRQYFCGVGGILLAALLAANIGLSASSAQLRAEVPLNEIFNLQIHSSHKWPDKVVLVVAEHQPLPVAKTRRKQHATSTWLSIQNSQTPRDAFAALNDPSADAPADYIAAQ